MFAAFARHEIDGRSVVRAFFPDESDDGKAPCFGDARAERGRSVFVTKLGWRACPS
jgi:hypothetical protein